MEHGHVPLVGGLTAASGPLVPSLPSMIRNNSKKQFDSSRPILPEPSELSFRRRLFVEANNEKLVSSPLSLTASDESDGYVVVVCVGLCMTD